MTTLNARDILGTAITKLQTRAERDRCWLIDMMETLGDAIAALDETQTFDRDHGDSIELDPAGWSRAVVITIRELLSLTEVAPLVQALVARGWDVSDKHDNTKAGSRTYNFYNDHYKSIQLDAYLSSDEKPACQIITVTKVTHVQEYLCEELR